MRYNTEIRPHQRVDLKLRVDVSAHGDSWSAWVCYVASTSKLAAAYGVQPFASRLATFLVYLGGAKSREMRVG